MGLATVCLVLLVFTSEVIGGLVRWKHSKRLLALPGDDVYLPRDEWLVQKLDHFDPANGQTWWQRYQTNATWFKNSRNSPVFLLIGGEGRASAKWMVTGSLMDSARKYNALCFQLEHRFYGESQPKDLSVDSLRYLNSEQALADVAFFIQRMNVKYNLSPTNKWVVFGGSYSGSLAAWARMKYPHLVHAAVSSSAPLRAQVDFQEFDSVVRKALTASSPNCGEEVHKAAMEVESLLKNSNLDDLSEKFHVCRLNASDRWALAVFLDALADNFRGPVQYSHDNRTPLNGVAYPKVDSLCAIMADEKMAPVNRFAAVNELSVNKNSCVDVTYEGFVQELLEDSDARSWFYQTCTEFGFYQTSSSPSSLFGTRVPIDFFVNTCQRVFGERYDLIRMTEGVERTNTLYGGLDIEVSRVVFVQGSLDPWHVLGLTMSSNGNMPVIFINGTAHCANMYPPSPQDPPQLTSAREEIDTLIGGRKNTCRMSCKKGERCGSDVDEKPVSRLLDVGQLPVHTPTRRHFVNPNFMFFCQIVLLIIPITVLYAGLYFMNLSSNVIIFICGAIVLVILCIFVLVRPFKEEKCPETKPLKRSYNYTPVKQMDEPGAMGNKRPTRTKRHRDDEDCKEKEDDDDDDNDDDDEGEDSTKNSRNDTILSMATSNFSESANETRIDSHVIPTEGTNASASNAAAQIKKEEQFGNSPGAKKQKWFLEDCDESSWGVKRNDNATITSSLGIIEEEEASRHKYLAPSACLERPYYTTKLLRPDVALSETTRSSNQTTTEAITPSLGKTRQQHLSQTSEGRTLAGYTTQENSVCHGKPSSPWNSRPEPQNYGNTTQVSDSDKSNKRNHNASHRSTHLTGSNAQTQSECTNQTRFSSTFSTNLSSPQTSTRVWQTFGKPFETQIQKSHHSPRDQYKSKQLEVVCANKLCPIPRINEKVASIEQKSSPDPNKSRTYCHSNTPDKHVSPKQERRGYLCNSEDVRQPFHERGYSPKPPKDQSNNLSEVPAFQTIKGLGDQIPSSEGNKNKQPILIKLFPTSSKDGTFVWEPNPSTHNNVKSKWPSEGQTADHLKDQHTTTDECVQTIGPRMVDTQTSAVFFSSKGQEQSNVSGSYEAQRNFNKQQRGAHQTKSGSMVDFILRPFSKVKPQDAKCTVKRTRRVKHKNDQNHQVKEQTNPDSSHFDLLRVQPRHNVDHKSIRSNEPKLPTKKDLSPHKERRDKLDICSIFYSSVTGKLYQPTRSGLLATDSSKETVERTREDQNQTSNMDYYGRQAKPNVSDHMERRRTKRKGEGNINRTAKCAKHTGNVARMPKTTMIPWTEREHQEETHEGRNHKYDSDVNSKITFMFPPFNLDFSSGPCDEVSKESSRQHHNKATDVIKAKDSIKKKSHPSQVQHQSKHKNRRISLQTETTLFKKSSSSYENVVIEKVVKQKKRTLKKFK